MSENDKSQIYICTYGSERSSACRRADEDIEIKAFSAGAKKLLLLDDDALHKMLDDKDVLLIDDPGDSRLTETIDRLKARLEILKIAYGTTDRLSQMLKINARGQNPTDYFNF